MNLTSRPAVTSDSVRQDAANVCDFLAALVAGVPGADGLSVAELMAHLAHTRDNPLGLELLTRAMQGAGKP